MKFRPCYTLFSKECTRFCRVLGQTVFTPMVTSSLYLLIFGISLGKDITFLQTPYLVFLIPGLLMMGVINNSYLNNSSTLILSKFFGDIEDLKVSPLTTMDIITGLSFAATVRGLMVAAIIFSIAEIFTLLYLESFIFPHHIIFLFCYLILAGLTFGMFGICVGMFSKSFETVNAISQFVLLPLIYLGGVFFRLDLLPSFWQKIAVFNPMFYYINGFRYAFLGYSDLSFSLCTSVIGFFFLFIFALTYLVTKKASFRHQ